uniref:basic proline-rich protein-like n=1 Tax=Jaculus jaculus TaxID=51337 RepID=UPI001E1B2E51|nr:basic proline-rich protein-like [Jaculus jaculus]
MESLESGDRLAEVRHQEQAFGAAPTAARRALALELGPQALRQVRLLAFEGRPLHLRLGLLSPPSTPPPAPPFAGITQLPFSCRRPQTISRALDQSPFPGKGPRAPPPSTSPLQRLSPAAQCGSPHQIHTSSRADELGKENRKAKSCDLPKPTAGKVSGVPVAPSTAPARIALTDPCGPAAPTLLLALGPSHISAARSRPPLGARPPADPASLHRQPAARGAPWPGPARAAAATAAPPLRPAPPRALSPAPGPLGLQLSPARSEPRPRSAQTTFFQTPSAPNSRAPLHFFVAPTVGAHDWLD